MANLAIARENNILAATINEGLAEYRSESLHPYDAPEAPARNYNPENEIPDVKVEWTGEYPCRCHGEWRVLVDGIDYSFCIPDEKRHNPMNIHGEYATWHFDDDYQEVWDTYKDGLWCDPWIAENPWVHQIPAPANVLYCLFGDADWRHGSCGGCI